MGKKIIAAKGRHVIEYPLDSAATFLAGAPVILDGDEEAVEVGADPAAILGFAEHSAGDGFGGTRDLLPGKVLVATARPGATFWAACTSAPTQDNIGKAYGIVKDSDDYWIVDLTDTTNTCVVIQNIDTELNLVEFTVEADTLVLA